MYPGSTPASTGVQREEIRKNFTVNGKAKKLRVKGDVRSNVGDALRIAAIQGCGLVQLPTYMVGLDIKSGPII